MNKSQLIEALSKHFEGNRKLAHHALEAVLDTVTREVTKGEKVAITGFGAFEKVIRPARTVRNPQTGARIRAKKTAVPKFRPGADLKAVVSGAKKLPKATASTPLRASAPAKSTTTKAASTTKSAASKQSSAKKSSPAKKTTASKSTATKSATAKSTASKSTASKGTAARKSASKSTASSPARKTTAAKTTSTAKSTAKKAPARKTTAKKTS
ncbi:MAG: HU family DNA-binding protein [Nocardioidaceae bacterium]|nr:HU family DNA-binding protein [Nocardioidaceae bacterium]